MLTQIVDIVVIFLVGIAAAVDIKKQIIPDSINGLIFALAILRVIIGDNLALNERILGFFSVSLFMIIINLIIKDAFGGGDIKLMAVLGAYYGVRIVVLSAIYGILLSGICGIILLITNVKNLKDSFALGPFLVVGIFYVLWIN